MTLKPGAKTFLKFLTIFAVVGGSYFGLSRFIDVGGLASKIIPSSVPQQFNLSADDSKVGSADVKVKSINSSYTATMLTIPWNATMGAHYAAAAGLFDKNGVSINILRQDDYGQMLAEMVKFSSQVANGVKNPTEGAAFSIIMGDGYPTFIKGAQEPLNKIGQQLEVVGAIGYSRGEDKCMLPSRDPQKAKGSLIGAVLRDGDWNICVKWASDNGIAINPDEKTYDPDAMNFIAVSAFTEADEKLLAGYSEERDVVVNGKRTGEKRKVYQNGTATWTPGDVKVAKQKGGMVAVASTKEYKWQMPAIIIGNKQWMAENPEYVQNMLAAIFEGSKAVNTDDSALALAAENEAKVYKEGDGAYWKRYYKGADEKDATGQIISLGGSYAIGLADNAFLFGLKGNDNLYKRVYSVFANIDTKYYPDVLPEAVPYDTVVNTTYLDGLLAKSTNVGVAEVQHYSTAGAKEVFAKKSYSIEFDNGKASFSPKATVTLEDLLDQVSVSGLSIQINGHTDNVGGSDGNLLLSKRRAEAVKDWLMANAGSTFPTERIKTRAYGDTQPVADNKTADGRAHNRRVEIVLLQE
jgi:outer membrane protein OmpA-like peptidoglycan-associated protein